jgi:outer membrane biosynthesis protein TonB
LRQIVVGDPSVFGGGFLEGQRLPPSPSRVASSVESLANVSAAPGVNHYLRDVLTRLRRSWQYTLPDSLSLGKPASATLALTIDRTGRAQRFTLENPSGNPELDRAFQAGVIRAGLFPPLPGEFRDPLLLVLVRLSYK